MESNQVDSTWKRLFFFFPFCAILGQNTTRRSKRHSRSVLSIDWNQLSKGISSINYNKTSVSLFTFVLQYMSWSGASTLIRLEVFGPRLEFRISVLLPPLLTNVSFSGAAALSWMFLIYFLLPHFHTGPLAHQRVRSFLVSANGFPAPKATASSCPPTGAAKSLSTSQSKLTFVPSFWLDFEFFLLIISNSRYDVFHSDHSD